MYLQLFNYSNKIYECIYFLYDNVDLYFLCKAEPTRSTTQMIFNIKYQKLGENMSNSTKCPQMHHLLLFYKHLTKATTTRTFQNVLIKTKGIKPTADLEICYTSNITSFQVTRLMFKCNHKSVILCVELKVIQMMTS